MQDAAWVITLCINPKHNNPPPRRLVDLVYSLGTGLCKQRRAQMRASTRLTTLVLLMHSCLPV